MIDKRYGLATPYSDGLMSKNDKQKLDDLSEGGGGGTDDYNDLSNLPSVGGVTLQGNKTIQELGGSNVSATASLIAGLLLGTVTVNGSATNIYAPEVLATKGAVKGNSQSGKVVDALVIKEILDLLPFGFGIDDQGNYGYYKDGADTVTPFSSGGGGSVIIADNFFYMGFPLETSYIGVYPFEDATSATGYERITVTLESV